MFETDLKPGVPKTFINKLRAKQLNKKINLAFNQKQAADELLKIAEDVESGKISEESGQGRALDLYKKYGLSIK